MIVVKRIVPAIFILQRLQHTHCLRPSSRGQVNVISVRLLATVETFCRTISILISASATARNIFAAWSIALTVAVATLVILGRPVAGSTEIPVHGWGWVLAMGRLVMCGLYGAAVRVSSGPSSQKALLLGTATGWLYGFVALLSKAVVDIYFWRGLVSLLTAWELWLLVSLAATLITIVAATIALAARPTKDFAQTP
ncbi:hypothetical protein I4J18_09350 [Corynebacterium diphtheriae bv. mitis]|nr:hypothetical protein [Corynebacterium diphtheriae bv. mitis]